MAPGFQRGNKLLKSLKFYKSLSLQKYRIKEGYFLVEGQKAIEQIRKNDSGNIEEIIVSENVDVSTISFPCPIHTISIQQFKTVSNTMTPQGILALIRIPDNLYSSQLPANKGDRILLLEHIQDPGNIGTLIRSAAALEYSGIIMSDQCADPLSPKAAQASAGSLFSVWLRRSAEYLEIAKSLKKQGYALIAADLSGSEKIDFEEYPRHVIAFGNEGSGLTNELIDFSTVRFKIPFNQNNAESLNVAVSGAIGMFCGKMKIGWNRV